MINKNYAKAGLRNLYLGQLSNCKATLNRLIKSEHLIPSEITAIRSALLELNKIDNINYTERQKIFGKINGFKKYINKLDEKEEETIS